MEEVPMWNFCVIKGTFKNETWKISYKSLIF